MKRPLKLSFQAKVLIPVIAALVLAPVIALWVLQQRVTAQFERDASRNLLKAEKTFKNSIEIRNRFLLARFRSVAEDSRVKAFSTLFLESRESFRDVEPTLNNFFGRLLRESEDTRWLTVTDTQGHSWSTTRDAALRRENFQTAAESAIESAFKIGVTVQTAIIGERLFNAVAVPMRVNNVTVAVVTFGLPLDEQVVREFASQTGTEAALIVGSNIVSTLNVRNLAANLAPALATFDDPNPQPLLIDSEHYYALSSRLSAGDKPFGYVLLSSYERQLRELQQTQTTLWLISLAGVLISAGAVWFFVGRATEPLRRLKESSEAVGRGDFTRRVEITTQDELGALGQSFNQMTKNLETSHAELQRTVETLKTTQAQLIQREKLSAVGEFVAGVAHELNNPLTSLIGFAELLQAGGVDSKQQNYLNYIVKSSQRCHKIVQSLLSFARQHAPERKLVKVSELLDSVLELLAYEMRTSNIEVLTKYDSTVPPIMGDSHQLQQVVLNILNNARQAIQANQPAGQIRLATQHANGTVKIVISDNGPGISQENLAKIFDPFFTTKPVGQGTGLGLSLCYGIVKEHGGALHASSRRGEGATFTIELPAAEPDSPKPGESAAAATPALEGAGKRLLIVDDEEWILTLIRSTLQKDGFIVDIATDGQAALTAISQNKYDLLICDQKMPGMSGPQLYQRLLSTNPATAHRVLFMTGDIISESFQTFLRQSGRTCLPKPFSLADLRLAISAGLRENLGTNAPDI